MALSNLISVYPWLKLKPWFPSTPARSRVRETTRSGLESKGHVARSSCYNSNRMLHRHLNHSDIFAQHRLSRDADHVLPDLRTRFAEVVAQLETVAGWRTGEI